MKQCKSCGGDCGKVCEYKGGESDMLTIAYMQGYSDGKKDRNPEGWQLVPIEPTEEMERAGWDVEELVTPCKTYAAMIKAAPKKG